MNITLIGMPGSGKSFVGQKLSEVLRFGFVEPDKILERIHGVVLQGVLEKLGNEAFLDAEAEVAITESTGKDNLIISPGGSMIYRPRTMNHLSTVSEIVYLETSFSVIEKRVGKVPRGIVFNSKTFKELYDQRIPLYEKWAKVRVNGDQLPEKVISDILLKLNLPESLC